MMQRGRERPGMRARSMSKVILSLKQSLVEWASRNLWSDVMVDCVPIPVRADGNAYARHAADYLLSTFDISGSIHAALTARRPVRDARRSRRRNSLRSPPCRTRRCR